MAALVLTVEGETNSGLSSILLIPAISMPWQIFFYVRSTCKNWSRKHNHAPFEGDLSSFWQDLV